MRRASAWLRTSGACSSRQYRWNSSRVSSGRRRRQNTSLITPTTSPVETGEQPEVLGGVADRARAHGRSPAQFGGVSAGGARCRPVSARAVLGAEAGGDREQPRALVEVRRVPRADGVDGGLAGTE